MADNHTSEQRHINMSHIRSVSSLENDVRRYLFLKGLRYRKNVNTLPGKPDIVFPKYKTVVFINGCFWHQHQGCSKAVIPSTHTEYWIPKLEKNKERDRINVENLKSLGWKVIIIWECDLSKNNRQTTLFNLYRKIIA